ncbi:hypothetical protein [Aestuariivirga sp.]|uniref:hypothetical protein n=1 Tax=Aestuariivirga sp. TaxID=2650926 RepID=UPI0025C35593|nr:hypothetical protein [Aestuariivirga sp.]
MRRIMMLSVLLAGCTYNAEVREAPAYNVVSSFGTEVPGKWLLYVDASPLAKPVKPAGYACSAHKFPIEMSGPFETSVRQTIDNVVEQVEIVRGPMSRQQVTAAGARGLIVVRGEELRPRLEVQPGFWSANMSASATLVASVTVDSVKAGRVLGATVEGQGSADQEAGMACEGGAKSLASAAGVALKDSMRKIGEAISNSERMRSTGN